MAHPILVTCAIIEQEGKYLLTQRPAEKLHGGRWEFPGGKVEHCEDPRKCLEREIKEELGITVTAGRILDVASHFYEELEKHVVLLAFWCEYVSGEISKRDIEAYEWVSREELDAYDITEADLPLVERLRGT